MAILSQAITGDEGLWLDAELCEEGWGTPSMLVQTRQACKDTMGTSPHNIMH